MKTIAKKLALSALFLTLFSGILLADGNDPKKNNADVKKVSVQVIDKITGETLAGVKVAINGSDQVVYTDFDGIFQLEYKNNSDLQISVSLISYENLVLKVGELDSGKINLERQK